jgi:hypothetical protein
MSPTALISSESVPSPCLPPYYGGPVSLPMLPCSHAGATPETRANLKEAAQHHLWRRKGSRPYFGCGYRQGQRWRAREESPGVTSDLQYAVGDFRVRAAASRWGEGTRGRFPRRDETAEERAVCRHVSARCAIGHAGGGEKFACKARPHAVRRKNPFLRIQRKEMGLMTAAGLRVPTTCWVA